MIIDCNWSWYENYREIIGVECSMFGTKYLFKLHFGIYWLRIKGSVGQFICSEGLNLPLVFHIFKDQ